MGYKVTHICAVGHKTRKLQIEGKKKLLKSVLAKCVSLPNSLFIYTPPRGYLQARDDITLNIIRIKVSTLNRVAHLSLYSILRLSLLIYAVDTPL